MISQAKTAKSRFIALALFLLGFVVMIVADGMGEGLGLMVPRRHVLLSQLVGKGLALLFLLAGFGRWRTWGSTGGAGRWPSSLRAPGSAHCSLCSAWR